jgi:protein tyrosine phosphatase (PTP) superfamily phosphohydrolase (DUF442 family)
MDVPPPRRRFSRRTLLRLAGAGLACGLGAEALRVFALTNKHAVIPGKVYRSAQLSPDELSRVIAEKKIRTVVNLRGTCPDQEWYLGECRATHAAGISQEDVTLSAKRLPAPAEVRRLVEVLDRTAYPILIHCQRGADRTGLVAAAVVLLQPGSTTAQARRQLWPRYGHIPAGRTVVIDRFLAYYEAWLSDSGTPHTPDAFRRWADHEYCPGPYRADLSLVGPNPPVVPAGTGFTLTIRAKNTSIEPWEFQTDGSGGIKLRYQLFLPGGVKLYKGHAGHFVRTVQPGEHIDLVAGFPPVKEPGRYLVHADLLDTAPIDLLDADFVQYGSEPLVFDVTVK